MLINSTTNGCRTMKRGHILKVDVIHCKLCLSHCHRKDNLQCREGLSTLTRVKKVGKVEELEVQSLPQFRFFVSKLNNIRELVSSELLSLINT